MTQRRLIKRLRKATLGNLGDVKPVGDGVFEMRENFGPGWRMYYIQRGSILIVMLGGGNKSTQAADIAKAVKFAAMIEE
jgi:putative addiction module killer protein